MWKPSEKDAGGNRLTRVTSRVLPYMVAWVLLGASDVFAGEGTGPRLDPERVTWTELRYEGVKFFLSAAFRVALTDQLENAPIPKRPSALPSAERQDPDDILLLELESSFGPRQRIQHLWLHPESGAALRRLRVETGRRNRYGADWYTNGGVYRYRLRPAEGEESLRPETWSQVSEVYYPYHRKDGASLAVTDPSAILYVLSASRMNSPDDRVAVHLVADKQVVRVEMVAGRPETVPVDYLAYDAAGSHRITGLVEALPVALVASPLADGADAEVELFGLKRDVRLYLDPRTRLPIEVRGTADPLLGTVSIKLKEYRRR